MENVLKLCLVSQTVIESHSSLGSGPVTESLNPRAEQAGKNLFILLKTTSN